jgi:hypothetical protein
MGIESFTNDLNKLKELIKFKYINCQASELVSADQQPRDINISITNNARCSANKQKIHR